jgi:hypothetical protein
MPVWSPYCCHQLFFEGAAAEVTAEFWLAWLAWEEEEMDAHGLQLCIHMTSFRPEGQAGRMFGIVYLHHCIYSCGG